MGGRAPALTVRAFRPCSVIWNSTGLRLYWSRTLSRLGRDYIQTGRYLELVFPEHGVRLIAVGDGIDTARADTDLAPFRNVINEMYARDTSRKIRGALHAKMQGRQVYRQFCAIRVSKRPQRQESSDTGRAGCDRRAADSLFGRAAGKRSAEIARMLNERGEVPPAVYRTLAHPGLNPDHYSKRKAWTSVGVSRMLRDVVYLGHIAQGKTDKISFKKQKDPRKADGMSGSLSQISTSRWFPNRHLLRCSASGLPAVVTGKGSFPICLRGLPSAWTAARLCPRSARAKKGSAANLACGAYKTPGSIRLFQSFLSRMNRFSAAYWRRCGDMSACLRMSATYCLSG